MSKFNQKTFDLWIKDKKQYRLKNDFDLSKDSIVIDAGTYKGNWAREIRDEYGCEPYCFEPLFGQHLNDLNNHQYALGNRDYETHISVNKDSSSIMIGGKNIKKILVKDVNKVFENIGKDIDLLKLNIEGAEYDVLERLFAWDKFKNIKIILVQFHRCPQNYSLRRKNIRENLKKTHKEVWCYDYIWERWDKNKK
ncbi:MAG TPA: FkbM family methyltransferase [Flavobacteriaceae bacterium]|nr:FkbM family methyltransferase [Flavobacteriaceae bacterium]